MLIKNSLVETVIQRPWFSPEDLDLGDLQTPEALERDVLVVESLSQNPSKSPIVFYMFYHFEYLNQVFPCSVHALNMDGLPWKSTPSPGARRSAERPCE